MSLREIAIVLPPRERFREGDAGAVALTIRDFCRASAYRERLTVLGGLPEHYADISYQHVTTPWAWLQGRNLAYALACIATLRDSPARIIEVHNRVALALRIKKGLPERRVSLHFHNDPQGMADARSPAERTRLLNALDAVYCVSRYVKDRLLEGVDAALAARVHIVHNALPVLPVASEASRQQWIVYAGRFIPEKGVLELARALAAVLPEHPEWKAVFLGAWGFGHAAGKSEYERSVYAALEPVQGQVEFLGHVAQETVMATLAQAEVAVAPSTGIEAFSRSAAEAMSSGCALIASRIGGLAEVVGDAGVIVDPVTADGLAAALRQLLGDAGQRRALALRGQQRVHELFSLETQAAALDAVRSQLLENT